MPETVQMKNSIAIPTAEEFFALQAQGWDARYQSRTYRARRELLLQIITSELCRTTRPREEIEVLDFGCGGGVLLSDLVELGVRVTGVDNSPAMIEKARAQLGQHTDRGKLELVTSSSGHGSYAAGSYNIVICTSVLEFVPELESVLAPLCSVVREGGILIVSVPNRRSWLRRAERFIHRHPRAFRSWPQFRHLVQPHSYLSHQHHQLTLEELTAIVELYGVRWEEHRFHVAPKALGALERRASIGMMLMAVFRKSE